MQMNTSVEPSPTYTEETECPITLEEYAESGDQQPVRLPQCGHSYSRAGVSMLLRGSQQAQGNAKRGRARTCPIQCPTCRTISRLKGIGDCKVDLRIIESIRRRAAETASKKFRFQDRIADQAGGVSSDSSDCTHGQLGSCNAVRLGLPRLHIPCLAGHAVWIVLVFVSHAGGFLATFQTTHIVDCICLQCVPVSARRCGLLGAQSPSTGAGGAETAGM